MTAILEPGPELAVEHIKPPVEDEDEWETPIFAFHDLDYIPSGYGGILAPYIETGPGSKERCPSPRWNSIFRSILFSKDLLKLSNGVQLKVTY